MRSSFQNIVSFTPPYTDFTSLNTELIASYTRGCAVVWYLQDAVQQAGEYEWLLHRPARVPLFIVLPPADAVQPILSMIPQLNELHARGVLPNGPLQSVEPVRMLLRTAPRDLPAAMASYFTRRGILRDTKTRALITKIFELAPMVSSISMLARRLYTSRRTLGRFFEAQGLPVPSHWLQFARLLYVSSKLQLNDNVPVFRVATQFGYPDGFTMSNQMKRLIGCRPTDVRQNLGYEWIVEEWLAKEGNAHVLSSASVPVGLSSGG